MTNLFITPEELRKILREEILKILQPKPAPQFDPNQLIFTIEEAAIFLRMSKHTIRKYVKLKRIKKAVEEVKGIRFHRSELERFAATRP